MRYSLFTVFTLASVLLALQGCGKASDVAQEKAIEAAISRDGVKADVDIDSDGNAVNYSATTADGATISVGEKTALPKDFPSDIPVLEGWKLQMVSGDPASHMTTVLASSDKTLDDVAGFFKKELVAKGWKEVTGTNVPGMMRTMEFGKDKRMVTLMISASEDKTTSVNLVTGDK